MINLLYVRCLENIGFRSYLCGLPCARTVPSRSQALTLTRGPSWWAPVLTRPLIWWHYIYDNHIVLLWTHGEDKLNDFITYLNNLQPTIKFTSSFSYHEIPSLDVKVMPPQRQIGNWPLCQTYSKHQYLLKSSCPVADPADLELSGGPGFDLLTLLAFSLKSFLLLLPKIRWGARAPLAPPPAPPLLPPSSHWTIHSLWHGLTTERN